MSQQDMENLNEICKAVENSQTKMDIPGNLPIEIFHEVLQYLSPRDFQNVRNCCSLWRNNMKSFWQIKCKMENYFESKEDLNSEFYRNFVKGFSHWEGIFMYNSKLRENWVNLKFKEISVINSAEILTIYHFCGDVIIVNTWSNEVLVINCTTGAVRSRFSLDDRANIMLIEKIDNRLIVVLTKKVGSGNPGYHPTVIYLKIWNIGTGELLTELEKEISSSVEKVIVYKDLPYAVCIYNIIKQDVDYYQDCVTSACHYENKIVLGNHTGQILMMDLDYTELMRLQCCPDDDRPISDIHMDGNYLVSMCEKRLDRFTVNVRACIWNIKTKTKLYEVPHVEKNDFKIFRKENKLCYSFNDFKKRAFNLCHLDTGDCLLELEFGGISTNNFLVIQRNYDNPCLLKMWSLKTGELVIDLNLPLPSECFNVYVQRKTTKSKIAYFDYDYSQIEEDESIPLQLRYNRISGRPDKVNLKIIDFQAQIEM